MHTTELHSYNATIRYALEKALKLAYFGMIWPAISA